MKVSRDTRFRPITITIETEDEFTFMRDLAEDASCSDIWNTTAKAFFSSFAEELRKHKEKK